MWVKLVYLALVLVVLVCAQPQEEVLLASDGVNVVCTTPGGNGGFFVDELDLVSTLEFLMVCHLSHSMCCICWFVCLVIDESQILVYCLFSSVAQWYGLKWFFMV